MKPNLNAWILLIIITPLFISGCQGVLRSSYSSYYSRLAAERYSVEISRLIAMTDESSPNFRANAHLYLSLLHSSHNNPEKNYSKALNELEKYFSLVPSATGNYELQNMLTLLKEINDVKGEGYEQIKLKSVNLKSKNEELSVENKKLTETVESQKEELSQHEEKVTELEETINQLNETINKLKNLDMELEKKRKSFR